MASSKMVAVLRTSKRAAAVFRAACPMRRRSSVSFASDRMASNNPPSSFCGTRKLLSTRVDHFGVAPMMLVMTGSPAAIASINDTGQASPSPVLGSNSASASESFANTSDFESVPVIVTQSSSPSSPIFATIASRCMPSPTMT